MSHDPRSPELNAMLRRLAPAEELAFRYAFCRENPYCRKDRSWWRRIHELEAVLTPRQRAAAERRSHELAKPADASAPLPKFALPSAASRSAGKARAPSRPLGDRRRAR